MTRQDQPEQPGSEALAHVGQIASVPGAREPVDHLGQDQRGKISQRSPGRHGRLLNAGPPEATNWTASAVNGSGAHKKSGNERAAGKRHGNTEHLQWSTFAEARSAGTLSRQQQAPVHHDHEFALPCFVAICRNLWQKLPSRTCNAHFAPLRFLFLEFDV